MANEDFVHENVAGPGEQVAVQVGVHYGSVSYTTADEAAEAFRPDGPDVDALLEQARRLGARARRRPDAATFTSVNVVLGNAQVGMQADIVEGAIEIHFDERGGH